ncbi:MAG TPA: hypothetical protein PLO24_01405 [Bacteroidales bacterium]|jgi:hypothetical protein|nr:hypothetical protein [Bacteroidales bacterium]HOS71426.1 hypothetical protein [Bacteroidales bacterium]HQH24922.1 hypothetical protein [Bacteroidales bacterium]HQJ82326.1 hypothetical protein [Bacteroidales bacterium]
MRIAFFLIILIHALIHLLGFLKGFEIKEIKEITSPVSRTMGVIWLTSFFLMLVFGILFLLNYGYSWIPGFIAALISQILVILFWSDARFGTIPNILILAVSLFSFGYFNFNRLIQQDTSQILGQNQVVAEKIINDGDIQHLPEPVRNWLYNSGMVGKPLISVGKVTQEAEMKMKPGQEKWMKAEATQYTALNVPAFIWTVELKINRLLQIQGRDKFADGKGDMLIKMNSLINIVNELGEKIDEGALQRYLGEMVWFPSLALSPYITWEKIDSATARAYMTFKGTSGSGIFYFNSSGDVISYYALRYKDNFAEAKRYGWKMNITEYKTFEGIKVPSKMNSVWELDEGDWTWLNLEVTDIRYNMNSIPGQHISGTRQ